LTPGVEVTTGPLGQGFANGIGMAIAQNNLANEFNTDRLKLFDGFIYAIVTDGDLMEGITSEAASLAGHLSLNRLIYLYDDNHISIEGPTSIAFSEDRGKRFRAYGWQVLTVKDGDNIEEINNAIVVAKKDPRPSLICCKTIIGKGLPTRQGTNKAHGEPPGVIEIAAAKRNANWPEDTEFLIPEDVYQHFQLAVSRGKELEEKWQVGVNLLREKRPEKYQELQRRLTGEVGTVNFDSIPRFASGKNEMSTRVASGKILNEISKNLPEIIGGAADLTPSTKTWLDGFKAVQKDSLDGRNIHFGVREHAMGAIVNGMAVYGGVIPYGATFLVFSDYMRTPLRLSAMSGYPSIWVFTHDSIGVGEDGPTHQPIEHVMSLRAIPGMVVIRPADANETIEAWEVAISRRKGPTSLILTRQDLPIIAQLKSKTESLKRGAYILSDSDNSEPDILLMATGSEVQLILQAGAILQSLAIKTRIISFPSWELFSEQDEKYQRQVIPPGVKARLAVEAGITRGWERWTGDKGCILGINHFGASAPYKELFTAYGLTVDNIVNQAKKILKKL
jgi:transketolase